jgi:hypothetical protein
MKSDKIKQIRKALQPESVKMDRLFFHEQGKSEPTFWGEIAGTGVTQIFSSKESVENYINFLKCD